ncbi:MAG: hypothetical protein IK095_02870 [Oscillospiraceae bacterium]|nr:hypothetical protein [Oscillospiraceae bacterium]
MFGFLEADRSRLTPEEQERYRACYCGLCRSLGERHGQKARLTLNYDMTFLVLLLQSLYEPEERTGKDSCPPHPFQPRPWQRSVCSDYAADLNVALAYQKCLDDWEDDGRLSALAAARSLQSAYERVQERYPRQCDAIARSLEELHALERDKIEDPDAASACFGRLLGELFVWRDDRWSGTLRAMGDALGRFLYVMDACVDLDADTFWGRYDPFRRYYGLPDNEQRFRDILKMLLGDCLLAFDRLPLVQDAGLLKNILCLGLWTRFDRKYARKKETADGAGSV